MRTLNADIILPMVGMRGLIEALREGHRDGVDGVDRSLLLREQEDAPPQILLTWPAWRYGAYAGVKIVTDFGAAGAAGSTYETVYVLFDGRDGRALATITGALFTPWKTAADSALAADFLARADAAVLAMLGAGAQAPALIAAHCAVRPSIERVLVWNRSPARAQALADELSRDGLEVRAVRDLETAIRMADIVSCATGTSEPLVRGEWLKAGAHLDLVGGFTPTMREADDTAVRRGRFFVDTRRFTMEACGDVAGPIASGALRAEAIAGDLYQLCRGEVLGREPGDRTGVTLFKNGGGGHLDLMTAIAIHRAAK